MRPLMVRTEKGSGPLCCSRLPVSGRVGGGGSRLLDPEAELDGGLGGGLAEGRQEIADLLLAGVDDLTGWRLVDGIGHPPAELLELRAERLHEGLGGELRWVIHGSFLRACLAEAKGPPGTLGCSPPKMRPPGRLGTPAPLPRPINDRQRTSSAIKSGGGDPSKMSDSTEIILHPGHDRAPARRRRADHNVGPPAIVTAAGAGAEFAWDEFFKGQLANAHTRKNYAHAVRR